MVSRILDMGWRISSPKDEDEFAAVAWLYGAGGDKSMKAWKSCGGEVVLFLRV